MNKDCQAFTSRMNLSHKVDYNSNTFIVQDEIIYCAMQHFHNDGIALYFWYCINLRFDLSDRRLPR